MMKRNPHSIHMLFIKQLWYSNGCDIVVTRNDTFGIFQLKQYFDNKFEIKM